MARRQFGGAPTDYVVNVATGAPLPSAVATVWTAATGGSQITDLQTWAGATITSVTPDADSHYRFLGPNDNTALVWLDTGGAYRYVAFANDTTSRVSTLEGTSARIPTAPLSADVGDYWKATGIGAFSWQPGSPRPGDAIVATTSAATGPTTAAAASLGTWSPDFTCTGTNDDVQIQAAIDYVANTSGTARTGGTVWIAPGFYRPSAPILLRTGVVLRGFGWSTNIRASGTFAGSAVIALADVNVHATGIQDLLVDGAFTTGVSGIQYNNSGGAFSTWPQTNPDPIHYMHNVLVTSVKGHGVTASTLWNGATGTGGSGNVRGFRMTNCVIATCGLDGLFWWASDSFFFGNVIHNTTGAGFHIHGANNHFVANKAYYTGTQAWWIETGEGNKFATCEAQDAGSNSWEVWSDHNTFSSITADSSGGLRYNISNGVGSTNGNTNSVPAYNVPTSTISGEGDGFVLTSSAKGNTVTGLMAFSRGGTGAGQGQRPYSLPRYAVRVDAGCVDNRIEGIADTQRTYVSYIWTNTNVGDPTAGAFSSTVIPPVILDAGTNTTGYLTDPYTANANVDWLSLGPQNPTSSPWIAGNSYTTPGGGVSTIAQVQNLLSMAAIYIPRAVTVTSLAAEVQTLLAGSTFQLGLWALNPATGLPGNQLITSNSMSGAATGVIVSTAVSVALLPGWYFIGHKATSATVATMRGISGVAPGCPAPASGNTGLCALQLTGAGAFPLNSPAVVATGGGTGGGTAVRVYVGV